MQNSEPGFQRHGAAARGCGGTELQRRGGPGKVAWSRGGAGLRRRGEAATLWRGAANRAARGATGSARGPARRLTTSA